MIHHGAPHRDSDGWIFPDAPEFVRQSRYQLEYNVYTGR